MRPLTDEAIEAIAAAVFDRPGVWVAEEHSDFEQPPREFQSAKEMIAYLRTRLSRPNGHAAFRVNYDDMGGHAVRRTVRLNPGAVSGYSFRFTCNTLKRALKWAAPGEDAESLYTWNWRAVASHERRLRRVLKQFVS